MSIGGNIFVYMGTLGHETPIHCRHQILAERTLDNEQGQDSDSEAA